VEKQSEVKPRRIGDGTPGPGRKKGIPNKTTTQLKEAILSAASKHGSDGAGADGLEGYLFKVAKEDVKAFAGLLGKVLPLQIDAKGGLHVHLADSVRKL
jgi:hypothetical protein